jgi:hypothetical protein
MLCWSFFRNPVWRHQKALESDTILIDGTYPFKEAVMRVTVVPL